MEEVQALAAASGVSLPSSIVSETMSFCDGLAPDATASMQRDIMAGRLSELEALSGYLARLGEKLGIPATVHNFIYGVLLPQELAARALAQGGSRPQ
jgi:2-dehydropantoate 2-reductase